MSNELRLYTGQLKYKEIDFTFVFDGSELRLLPPREKREEIWRNWIMTPLGKGIYTMGQPMIVENPILIGRCNESSQTIIFIIREGNSISNRNTVLFIRPDAYIVCKYDREMIDRISFSSAEINCIHPVNQAFYSSFNLSNNSDDGVVTITAKDFASTTTKQQEFMIDGKRAYVEFGVTRGISYKIGESPLMLTSSLIFDIEPTNDYVFIYKLWRIAKCFIQYLQRMTKGNIKTTTKWTVNLTENAARLHKRAAFLRDRERRKTYPRAGLK